MLHNPIWPLADSGFEVFFPRAHREQNGTVADRMEDVLVYGQGLAQGHAPVSTLLINDFMAGVGELGVAAMHARARQEATEAGVRVCYWGFESRTMFAQIANANINTTIGELFLANRLTAPGLQPIQAPVQASGCNRGTDRVMCPS